MIHIVRTIVIAVIFLLTTGTIAGAAVDPIKEIVSKVEGRYRATKDLMADFNQTTTVKGFATALKSAGRVYLKRAGKLRWDYLEPNLEQIFVDMIRSSSMCRSISRS